MQITGLDQIDNRIIELLKENARLSYSEVGKVVGLSRVTVKRRIEQMEKSGIIRGYHAVIDPEATVKGIHFTLDLEVVLVKTLLHEMSHSSGAPGRLNRDMGGMFGSDSYAKEELRAEIGSLFTGFDLGLKLNAEHYEDHSDYLKSWISVLKNDYNELFRACADAEKISERLVANYCRKYELSRDIPGYLHTQDEQLTPCKTESGKTI